MFHCCSHMNQKGGETGSDWQERERVCVELETA